MRNTKTVFTALVTICFTSTIASAGTLTAEEIQEKIIGKSLSWVTLDGETKGTAKHRKNGNSSVSVKAPYQLKDKGTWRLQGNQFCTKFVVLRDGKERCTTYKTTNKTGVYKTDTVFVTAK